MNPDQVPESCPFCGAGVRIEANGTDGTWQRGDWALYDCGSAWHRLVPAENLRNGQTPTCVTAERSRLTRERDDALMMLGVYKMDKDGLKARLKRLEEAGDKLLTVMRGEEGTAYCEWIVLAYDAETNWLKAKEAKP